MAKFNKIVPYTKEVSAIANNTGNHCVESRVIWIDCLKFFSVFAVFVNHTYQILYNNKVVWYISFFCVSVFVFLSGMTSFQSNVKHMSEPWEKDMARRLKRVLIPYAIATACYLLYENHVFDLITYLNALIRFDAAGPFYFLVFYLQLILIARCLTKLVSATANSNFAHALYALELAAFTLLGAVFIKYTYIVNVAGGGSCICLAGRIYHYFWRV